MDRSIGQASDSKWRTFCVNFFLLLLSLSIVSVLLTYYLSLVDSSFEPDITLNQVGNITLFTPRESNYMYRWETSLLIEASVIIPHNYTIVIDQSSWIINSSEKHKIDQWIIDKYDLDIFVKLRHTVVRAVSPDDRLVTVEIPVVAEIWIDPQYFMEEDRIQLGRLTVVIKFIDVQTQTVWPYDATACVVWTKGQ